MAEPKWAQGLPRHEIIARVDNMEADLTGEGRLALDVNGDSILGPDNQSLWVPRAVYEDEWQTAQRLGEELRASQAAYAHVHQAIMGETTAPPGGAAALGMMAQLLHHKIKKLKEERASHWAWEAQDLSDLRKNAADEYPIPDADMASEEFRERRRLQREAYVEGRTHESERHRASEASMQFKLDESQSRVRVLKRQLEEVIVAKKEKPE